RDLRAAGVGKARQLREIADRHDAGNDRYRHARRFAGVDEAKVAVGVVEVLGDRRIRAGVDLALEVPDFVVSVAGLRVVLGIAGDVDVKPVSCLGADELDELVRVAQLAASGETRGEIPAQGDDVAYAARPIALELGLQLLAGGGDAREVRSGLESG